MPDLVTIAQAARTFGIRKQALYKAANKGWLQPAVVEQDGKRLVDMAVARQCRQGNLDPTKQREPDANGGGGLPHIPEYSQSRQVRAHLQNRRLLRQVEEEEGSLCSVAEIVEVLGEATNMLRSGLENLPDRIAGRLVGLDEREIRDQLNEEIKRLLGSLQSKISEL